MAILFYSDCDCDLGLLLISQANIVFLLPITLGEETPIQPKYLLRLWNQEIRLIYYKNAQFRETVAFLLIRIKKEEEEGWQAKITREHIFEKIAILSKIGFPPPRAPAPWGLYYILCKTRT